MPPTKNLLDTVNWCAPYLRYQPQTIGGLEPALTAGNIVLQTILGPPFRWPENRSTFAFACVSGVPTQDYIITVPDFGFMEKMSLIGPIRTFEIENKDVLGLSSEQAEPTSFAAQEDDSDGNITFRLLPPPDQGYGAVGTYQRAAPLLTSMASQWTPLGNKRGYIYNWGFLAILAMLIEDERFPIFERNFLARLLGAQSGLDETQKNLFLGNWLLTTMNAQRSGLRGSQGVQALGI